MLLWSPECGERHVDEGEFATKVHHTHACQNCGHVWRPAIVPTVGVRFLPGFKNGEPATHPAEDIRVQENRECERMVREALGIWRDTDAFESDAVRAVLSYTAELLAERRRRDLGASS
jgi:hypothetical protein